MTINFIYLEWEIPNCTDTPIIAGPINANVIGRSSPSNIEWDIST